MKKELLALQHTPVVMSEVQRKLNYWSITDTIWDLDGTLINTKFVFDRRTLIACEALLDGPISSEAAEEFKELKELKDFTYQMVEGLRSQFWVNPMIMEIAVHLTALRLDLSPNHLSVDQAINQVRQIYLTAPPLFEGALASVEMINATGKRSILVTHAGPEWTWSKRYHTGLIGKFEQVVCLSVDHSKASQWPGVFKRLNINPEKTLVIGDSLESDIAPTVALGAQAIWVSSKPNKTEQLQRAGLAGKVIIANHIKDLQGVILEKDFV